MTLAMKGVVGSRTGASTLAGITVTRGYKDLAAEASIPRIADTHEDALPLPGSLAASVLTRGRLAPRYLLSETVLRRRRRSGSV